MTFDLCSHLRTLHLSVGQINSAHNVACLDMDHLKTSSTSSHPSHCVTDDLPRLSTRGGVAAARRPSSDQLEGLMELDRVDSRGRRWRRFCISGHEYHVNMSVLEPYLQVLSHGGQRFIAGRVVGGVISVMSFGP